MGTQQQQVGSYRQFNLFEVLVSRSHVASGKGGTGAGACEERQISTALNEGRALAKS